MADSSWGLRIGDADRQEAVEALGEQYAQGRLTREELDERTDAVWSAKTQGDLAPIFVDLPVAPPGTGGQPRFQPRSQPRPAPRSWQRGPAGLLGVRRLLVPLFAVLLAITILTHLPFVLLAVGLWFWFGHLRWHHVHGVHDTDWHGRIRS